MSMSNNIILFKTGSDSKGKIYLDDRYKIDRAFLLLLTKFNEKGIFYSERS